MTIAHKLTVNFVVTVILVIGAIATTIVITVGYEQRLEAMHRNNMMGTVALASAMDELWQLRYGFPQFMVLGEDDRRRIVAEEPRRYAAIARHLKTYSSTPRSAEERQSLEGLEAAFRRYVEARPRWFELYGAGKIEEAAAWRARTTTPFGAETVAAFERQIDLQEEIAKRDIERALDYLYYSRILLFLVFAVVLVAVSAKFLLSLRLLRPLRLLSSEADATMREVFGENMKIEGKDEVVTLVDAFRRMTGRFVSHTSELTRTREELDRQRQGLERTVSERTGELSRVLSDVEQQAREATMFYEMGDRLQSCQTLEEAAQVMTLFGGRLFPGFACAIYVTRASRNLLEPVLTSDVPALDQSFAPEECWALRRGKLHRVDDVQDELVCAHVTRPMARAYLCVPLMAQGEAIGLMHLQRSESGVFPDGAATEKRAVAAAGQIGLAVGNLRLRETLRTLALRDPLTGLYNRRFLDETLERETARAQRKNLPLAVIMIDVDHFKRFNDNFGHEAGDIALKAVAQLMRNHFRVSDYACRYGGEEFTVVMPEAPLDSARQRAESFRVAAAGLALTQSGRALSAITISMGLASMPANGSTAGTLLQAADAALYQAKDAGRNRLVVSGAAV